MSIEWDGKGLPPVGCECEYAFIANYREKFSRGKVIAYGKTNVFMQHWASENEFIQPLEKIAFRPILTEPERRRNEIVQIMCNTFGNGIQCDEKSGYGKAWFEVYDAIAAGKIPGIRLTDDAGS